MIPDDRVSSFHEGQVWRSPRGILYRVVESTRWRHAVLRKGSDGAGRIVRRSWDAVIGGWVLEGDPEDPVNYPVGQDQVGRTD